MSGVAVENNGFSSLPVLSGQSLHSYLNAVHQIPKLTRSEESILFERFQNHQDLDAARRLVLAHLRYVVYIARGYAGYGLPLEDLIQQGNLGLMQSVKKFEPGRKLRLITFAVHWIKAEIHEYILKNWKLVKVATTKAQRKLFFNLRKNKRAEGQIEGREVVRIAQLLDVSEADVVEMDQRLRARDSAFEQRDEDDLGAPESYLQSETAGPCELVEQAQEAVARSEQLAEALEALDARSLRIVQSRWLGEEKTALKTLAEEFGISIERVRQLEGQALKKLQGFVTS
ncbi:MAG: RNA polymerase sigma factor RpoH [Pseudomonadales bacterium]|jgi:RNA polymerase sigma-32 factor